MALLSLTAGLAALFGIPAWGAWTTSTHKATAAAVAVLGAAAWFALLVWIAV